MNDLTNENKFMQAPFRELQAPETEVTPNLLIAFVVVIIIIIIIYA